MKSKPYPTGRTACEAGVLVPGLLRPSIDNIGRNVGNFARKREMPGEIRTAIINNMYQVWYTNIVMIVPARRSSGLYFLRISPVTADHLLALFLDRAASRLVSTERRSARGASLRPESASGSP